ncbi:hypothetical protein OKW41_002852 [Paraburkholderia sp. UCT70]
MGRRDDGNRRKGGARMVYPADSMRRVESIAWGARREFLRFW